MKIFCLLTKQICRHIPHFLFGNGEFIFSFCVSDLPHKLDLPQKLDLPHKCQVFENFWDPFSREKSSFYFFFPAFPHHEVTAHPPKTAPNFGNHFGRGLRDKPFHPKSCENVKLVSLDRVRRGLSNDTTLIISR